VAARNFDVGNRMGKHIILVTDADKSIVDRVKHALSPDGYRVQIAGSSQEAVDAARQIEPDLLIINPIMPVRSGVETAKQISQAVGSKVLFLSDLARDADFREVIRGLKQQGCDCSAMERQFEARELLAYVRREIGSLMALTNEEDADAVAAEVPRPDVAAAPRSSLINA